MLGLGVDISDGVYFGFVYMPVRKMFKKIAKRENIQFFFQQVCALRPYTFQVFDRAG
jgi:hypothetical protein